MIQLAEFLASDPDQPAPGLEAAFQRIARLTALRRTAGGDFYVSNYHRAHLLYLLLRRHRPDTVLEVGTGRGYGALALAIAAEEAQLPTRILTVDVLPPTEPQQWALDEGSGPKLETRSIVDVWRQLPAAWTSRITFLTGASVAALGRLVADPSIPPVDFAFIDGGHDYWTARHDVLAAILAARGRPVTLLLDDYGGIQGLEVMRLVEDSLAPRLPAGALSLIAMPQSDTEFQDNGSHGMAYIDGRIAHLTPELLVPNVVAGYAAHRVAARLESAALRARYRLGSALRGRSAFV